MKPHAIIIGAFLALAFCTTASAQSGRPNIILIYGDDVGYGDLGCYGATTIPTPNIDQLAAKGLRFTAGYCTSATCTPSRYSLLTGEYAWRVPGTGIAPPNATALISPQRVTLASLLKEAGYATGIVGKWHLGLGRPPKPDWSGKIAPGPLEIGFDTSFIMPTTNDRVPCVYVEGHRVANLDSSDPVDVFMQNPDGQPTGITQRDTLKMDWSHDHNNSIVNGVSRIGFMSGGTSARWIDEEMSDVFTNRAKDFIKKNAKQPFFLFFSSQDIHVPRMPHARFRGKTSHGPRGDAVVEFDASVGALVDTLKQSNLIDNTLIILTSDNGPVLDDGYRDDAVKKLGDHRPAGPFRGGKYSIFEGGTRVPFIVSWPAKVSAGVSNALISQVDLAASLRTIAEAETPLQADAIPDSLDLSPALLGQTSIGREAIVEHAGTYALRKADWKYIEASQKPVMNQLTNTELGNNKQPQLYNLADDPGERHNLAEKMPAKVAELKNQLDKIIKSRERESAISSASVQ
ncbi:MAG: sulfatase-like hydrolase/transferase [Verrucomicrobiota bacterium]|nr:sulfatase-like hydrolase/transferase [Verrucomicrobiota bacterium]